MIPFLDDGERAIVLSHLYHTDYCIEILHGLAYFIDTPTASGIVYWIVLIVVMAVLIGGVLFGFGFVLFLYGGYVRENLWDRHTVIVITVDIAVTLFLVEEIRNILPLNLAALQIMIFIVYSLIRMLIVCRHE